MNNSGYAHETEMLTLSRTSVNAIKKFIVVFGIGLFVLSVAVTSYFVHHKIKQGGPSVYAAYDEQSFVQSIVVKQGDTLWSIARSYGPVGEDVRVVVDRIRDMNDLDGAFIHPGDVLRVPLK